MSPCGEATNSGSAADRRPPGRSAPKPVEALGPTRRRFLAESALGVGAAALWNLLAGEAGALGSAGGLQFPARARSVIALHMVGAPSQLDLFDPKPELLRHDGRPVPESLIAGQRFAFLKGRPRLLGSRFRFRRYGACGMELSELLPHLGSVADDIALVRTVRTEEFNHAPAQLFMQTGFSRFGHPSLGSWVAYGLGSESRDLPAFVVLVTGKTAGAGNSLWGSGFLPARFQGVRFRNQGDPVLFLSDAPGLSRADKRRILDGARRLNELELARTGAPEITTRIAQYELAFRMQAAVPELMEITREPRRIHELYGTTPGRPSFANHCLLARRLVERGVRFVALYDADWDHHSAIQRNLPRKCRQVDRPVAALIRDLKERGLLDETLVVWTSEFGRTPMLQGDAGKNPGRDHHKEAFTVWLAGGGVRGGFIYGRTDDLGYYPVEDPAHVHDLHATILHCLGIDHERLTFRHRGRDFRLTDVGGRVVRELLL